MVLRGRQISSPRSGCWRTIAELARVEPAFLVEDRLGDADLADVVELSGDAQQVALAVGQPEGAPELGGQHADPLGVAAGVGVLGLEGRGQREDHALVLLEVPEVVAEAQQRLDAGDQLQAVDGQDQEVVGPDPRAVGVVGQLALRRGQDDRQELRLRPALDGSG